MCCIGSYGVLPCRRLGKATGSLKALSMGEPSREVSGATGAVLMGMGIAWRPTGVTREIRKATATNGGNRSRLNILIAATAAIVVLIYGCDLGSIASALLFLVPAFDLSTFMTSVVTLGQLLGRSSPDTSPTRSVVNARWL